MFSTLCGACVLQACVFVDDYVSVDVLRLLLFALRSFLLQFALKYFML
jgi:hypothetical protein